MRSLAAALAALTLLAAPLARGEQGDRPGPARPPARAPAKAAGQWVFTTLFGWIWAPRGEQYTHYRPGEPPRSFVYFAPKGWQWIVAPWVWGNWWPFDHRPFSDPKGEWSGASLDGWQHRREPKPAASDAAADGDDSFDDDDPFGDDNRPFAFDQAEIDDGEGDGGGSMWFGL